MPWNNKSRDFHTSIATHIFFWVFPFSFYEQFGFCVFDVSSDSSLRPESLIVNENGPRLQVIYEWMSSVLHLDIPLPPFSFPLFERYGSRSTLRQLHSMARKTKTYAIRRNCWETRSWWNECPFGLRFLCLSWFLWSHFSVQRSVPFSLTIRYASSQSRTDIMKSDYPENKIKSKGHPADNCRFLSYVPSTCLWLTLGLPCLALSTVHGAPSKGKAAKIKRNCIYRYRVDVLWATPGFPCMTSFQFFFCLTIDLPPITDKKASS